MYEEYEDYDLQPNRHRKVKQSTKQKVQKSKHKHQYVDCVFKSPNSSFGGLNWMYWTGKYCSVCGKIQIHSMTDSDDNAIPIDSLWQKEITV